MAATTPGRRGAGSALGGRRGRRAPWTSTNVSSANARSLADWNLSSDDLLEAPSDDALQPERDRRAWRVSNSGGSFVSTAVSVSTDVSPLNARLAAQHLVEHRAEREDVRAMIDGQRARLLRGHVAERAQDGAGAGRERRDSSCDRRRRRSATDLARPKSRILTWSSRVIITFSGLRSRWTRPRRARQRSLWRAAARRRPPGAEAARRSRDGRAASRRRRAR